MIDILSAVILISILVVLWINYRILKFIIKNLEDTNGYLHRLIEGLRADNDRLLRRMSGAGTYTYEDNCGNKYDDVVEVTYNDLFLIIKRRSGSVAIPRNNNNGYTMTKNITKEEPEDAKSN